MSSCLLFKNAKIFQATGAKGETYSAFDSLLVIDKKIAKIGTYSDCKAVVEAKKLDVQEVDCQNKTLAPGFIDAHNHMTLLGASLRAPKFNYPDVSCIDDVVGVVKNAVAARKPGEWVRGWGLDYGKFPNAIPPTRFDLDKVSPDNPVAIVHYTGHFVLVNTKALEMAGIDDNVEDPKGGRFLRDEQGRINGIAQDSAQQLVIPTSVDVQHHGPDIGYLTPIDELVADIEFASKALHAVGVTAVLDPQVTTREMVGLVRANNCGALSVRTMAMFLSNHLGAQLELGILENFGNDILAMGPIKYYCDGAIVGATAAFTKPFNNRNDDYTGSLYWENTEDLYNSLELTHSKGLQFGIHTQGDRAHEIVLSCVERFLDKYPRANHRHRLEHSGYPTQSQIKRMAKCGLIPITQPGQLREAGKNLIDNYGVERATCIYPLRSFLDNGIKAVLSSDAFVQSYNPMSTIFGAVERRTDDGLDLGQAERISMSEAIQCHTIFAAESYFWEDKIGSLEEGKLADIILFDCDVLEQEGNAILDAKINMTVLGGEVVYTA